MPAKAQWLLRVPEILAELAALDVPVLDRAVCERLFRLRRRRTIDLSEAGLGNSQLHLAVDVAWPHGKHVLNLLDRLAESNVCVGEPAHSDFGCAERNEGFVILFSDFNVPRVLCRQLCPLDRCLLVISKALRSAAETWKSRAASKVSHVTQAIGKVKNIVQFLRGFGLNLLTKFDGSLVRTANGQ